MSSTKELPKEVQDIINKQYPLPQRIHYKGLGWTGGPETMRMEELRKVATAWAHIALEFAEWKEDKYLRDGETGLWYSFNDHPHRDQDHVHHKPLESILLEYLKTIPQ
jgi:hypothetical protein